jgi:hypothetical protein
MNRRQEDTIHHTITDRALERCEVLVEASRLPVGGLAVFFLERPAAGL